MKPEDMHHKVVDFGKHKGELWTRVPVSYLNWLANQNDGERGQMARLELQRRGTTINQEIELTGHAVDRASLRCARLWRKDIHDMPNQPGIYSWLYQLSLEAWKRVNPKPAPGEVTKIKHKRITFVFQGGHYYPVLKSVMRQGGQ